jgi:hypothetical protein
MKHAVVRVTLVRSQSFLTSHVPVWSLPTLMLHKLLAQDARAAGLRGLTQCPLQCFEKLVGTQ